MIHDAEQIVRNHLESITGIGFSSPKHLFTSSLASTWGASSQTDRMNGVLVIDIGAGCTDWSIFKNGHVQKTGVIAIGGDHLSNDLAMGFNISWEQAEAIKLRFSKNSLKLDEAGNFWIFENINEFGNKKMSKKALETILYTRIEELFGLIKEGNKRMAE